MNKIILFVPYEEKERAKVLGAMYDPEIKSWYCDDGKKICIDEWSKRFVDVPYDKKMNLNHWVVNGMVISKNGIHIMEIKMFKKFHLN